MKNNEMDCAALLEALAQAAPPQEETVLDLRGLFRCLRARLWVILACFVAGAVLAFGATYCLLKPQYKATGELYLVSPSNAASVELTDLQLSSSLVSDYQELLCSRLLLEDVLRGLSLDMTADELADSLRIENPSGSHVLRISAFSANPQQAADIANEMLRQAVLYLPRIMEIPEPNVIHHASVPTQKDSPSYSRNTAAGAFLGALAGCCALALRFILRDTITSPELLARYFGMRPLVTLPAGGRGLPARRGQKAAAAPGCAPEALPAGTAKAVERLRVSLRSSGAGRVIAVASSLPGDGKSFVAAQLWRSMAQAGLRVLLLDGDLRGECAAGKSGAAGLAPCLAGRIKPADAIRKTDVPNGWLLPAAPAEDPARLLEGQRLDELAAYCRQNFDAVLVDTPALDTAADALRLAGCCDGILLVVRSGRTPRRQLADTLYLLERIGKPLLGVVLNEA